MTLPGTCPDCGTALPTGSPGGFCPRCMLEFALGGFLVRMGLVTVVVLAVRHQPWANLTALAVTILVTHLGLLAWETKYVSATLAYPGLAPRPHASHAASNKEAHRQ